MSDTMANLNISTVTVPCKSKVGRTMQAYYVTPDDNDSLSGVVIIHEAFGLNDNIRDIAQRFARQGYAALAVDLFTTGNRASCLIRLFYHMLFGSPDNGVVADLGAALDHLRAQPNVDAERVGAVGFCMGGTFALQLACVNDDLRAASVFYGMNPRPLASVAQACPIVGHYPEKDFTLKAGQQLEAALTQYNVPHDIKVYPDARHSFFNDRRGNHHPEAASDAWTRMLGFFDKHLRRAQ